MRIIFDKIGSTAKPIGVTSDSVSLEGTLQKSGYHQVTLEAILSGDVELFCDRCGDAYDYKMDSKLRLKLSDLVSEDKDDLDIIEFLDGKIDILHILQSEITSLKSDYSYCDNCDNDNEDFEKEY